MLMQKMYISRSGADPAVVSTVNEYYAFVKGLLGILHSKLTIELMFINPEKWYLGPPMHPRYATKG